MPDVEDKFVEQDQLTNFIEDAGLHLVFWEDVDGAELDHDPVDLFFIDTLVDNFQFSDVVLVPFSVDWGSGIDKDAHCGACKVGFLLAFFGCPFEGVKSKWILDKHLS